MTKLYLYGFNDIDSLHWVKGLKKGLKIKPCDKLADLQNAGKDESIILFNLESNTSLKHLDDVGIKRNRVILYGDVENFCSSENHLCECVADWIPEFKNANEASIKLNWHTKRLRKYLENVEGICTELALTQKEEKILQLISSGNQVKKDDLHKYIWKDSNVGKKTIDVHLFNLRKKLKTINKSIILNKNGTLEVA